MQNYHCASCADPLKVGIANRSHSLFRRCIAPILRLIRCPAPPAPCGRCCVFPFLYIKTEKSAKCNKVFYIFFNFLIFLFIPDARHFQPVRPCSRRQPCLQNACACIGSFDHLAVSDIDADMPFLPNRNAGDLWHRRNRSFFFCLLKHPVCTDIGMSAASVLNSFRFRIQP